MYRAKSFPINESFNYAYSTKDEGNMDFRFSPGNEIIANRTAFLEKVGINPENAVGMKVVFGDTIIIVGKKDEGKIFSGRDSDVECDALITSTKGTALFLATADCIPVILVDKKRTVISLIHNGLKNTEIGLIPKVVSKLREEFNVNPGDLEILFGPAIQQCSYAYDYFEQKDSTQWREFCQTGEDGKIYIDNVGLALQQAMECGIQTLNIHNTDINTYTDTRFYSHKFDHDSSKPDQGRFATVVQLV